MAEPVKSLLEALTDPDENVRLRAVADLVFQSESYARALTQSLCGLIGNYPSAARDLFSVKTFAEETANWLNGHYQAIQAHLSTAALSPTASVAEPTKQNLH